MVPPPALPRWEPASQPLKEVPVAQTQPLTTTHSTHPTPTAPLLPTGAPRLIPTPLPRELFNAIITLTWSSSFLPGFLLLQRRPSYSSSNTLPTTYTYQNHTYEFAHPTLLYVNHMLVEKYEQRMWSENTIVIGTGPPESTTDFFAETGSKAFRWIKKIHISFSVKDLYYPNPFPGFITRDPHSEHEDLEQYNTHIAQQNGELRDIWQDKIRALHNMELEELVMDFRDAWKVQGGFLGREWARSLRWVTFARKVEVLAPDGGKKRKVVKALRRGNEFL